MNRVENRKQLETEELNALIVFNFLKMYNEFESVIKNEFVKYIDVLKKNPEKYSRVWFYVGGLKANSSYANFGEATLEQDPVKYKERTLRSTFTFNNIMKLNLSEKFIDKFDFEVNSINNRSSFHDFHTVCDKLIKMRNILSHEINKSEFGDKEIIELLTIDSIKKVEVEWLKEIDISNIEVASQSILSNYIIMKRILKEKF